MTPKLPENVLLIYKKSKYQLYFLENRKTLKGLDRVTDDEMTRWREAHERHVNALEEVRRTLVKHSIKYREAYRANRVRYELHDLVVSVGGDGTFIEAARRIGDQPILGVNSDPTLSVGHFCSSNADDFEEHLLGLSSGTVGILSLNRLCLKINGKVLDATALNDVLIASHRPAAISRYSLRIGDRTEEQLGSGLWVCTAMGSYGAMRSAGGVVMDKLSSQIQYMPRELYDGGVRVYELRGATLNSGESLTVTSRMRDGEISMDGCRCRIPFGYGNELGICNASTPVNLVLPIKK